MGKGEKVDSRTMDLIWRQHPENFKTDYYADDF